MTSKLPWADQKPSGAQPRWFRLLIPKRHLKQMSQESGMKKRGNLAMGFDQEKVSHHFYLTRTGGAIEVSVNQNADEVTRKQIREHLRTISQEFADGVFTSPIATHAEEPLGVPVLRQRKARIAYTYQETPDGARVIISTTDRAARAALHDFLRYQIREHTTGDPVSVTAQKLRSRRYKSI